MIGLLILQIFFVSGPPPTQAEALRILREMPSVTNVARWPEPAPAGGPRVTFTGATGPTLGPWDWPAVRPLRAWTAALCGNRRRSTGFRPGGHYCHRVG
jgi:hypothetical protein